MNLDSKLFPLILLNVSKIFLKAAELELEAERKAKNVIDIKYSHRNYKNIHTFALIKN